MKISIIAAMDDVGTIGKDGEIPWRQSADLREFARLTRGHYVVIGRLTWASLPERLQGRKLIVLTQHYTKLVEASGAIVRPSLTSAIDYAREQGETELFLAGGTDVYALGFAYAEQMYLTKIHTTIKGNNRIKFPEVDWSCWAEVQSRGPSPADDRNQYSYTFAQYQWYRPPAPPRRKRLPRPVIICEQCKKTFTAKYMPVATQPPQRYCSRKCQFAGHVGWSERRKQQTTNNNGGDNNDTQR